MLGVFIDQNNRISLSRFQVVLWSALIISGYIIAGLANAFASYNARGGPCRLLPAPFGNVARLVVDAHTLEDEFCFGPEPMLLNEQGKKTKDQEQRELTHFFYLAKVEQLERKAEQLRGSGDGNPPSKMMRPLDFTIARETLAPFKPGRVYISGGTRARQPAAQCPGR